MKGKEKPLTDVLGGLLEVEASAKAMSRAEPCVIKKQKGQGSWSRWPGVGISAYEVR